MMFNNDYRSLVKAKTGKSVDLKGKGTDLRGKPKPEVVDLKATQLNTAPVQEQVPAKVTSEFVLTPSGGAFPVYEEHPLNEGQAQALEEILEFLQDPTRTSHALIGNAGSGKTTTLKSLLNTMSRASGRMKFLRGALVLSTPTHRANSIVRKHMPKERVVTLASLIGSGKVGLEFNTGNGQSRETFSLLIMDESSMISPKEYQAVLKVCKERGAKILFLGDDAQLGPIKGNEPSPALTSTEKVSRLTQVMRAKNSQLLDECTLVREEGRWSCVNNMNPEYTQGVGFSTNPLKWMNFAMSKFKSDHFKEDLLSYRLLAFTNRRVEELNRQVRVGLWEEKALLPYVPGDVLMGYQPTGSSKMLPGSERFKGDHAINNGLDYVVHSVKETEQHVFVPGYGEIVVPVYELEVNEVQSPRPENFCVYVLRGEIPETLMEVYRELWELNETIHDFYANPKTRSDARVKFFSMNEAVDFLISPKDILTGEKVQRGKYSVEVKLREKGIDYAYCHTIHKSQGGTYGTVFVDAIDIFKCKDTDARRRLMYVAVSRAEDAAIVLVS